MNCNTICGTYNLIDIDKARLRIRNEVSSLSDKTVRNLKTGYGSGSECDYGNKISKLNKYGEILTKVKNQALNGSEICLNTKDLQSLMSKVTDIVGKNCGNPKKVDYCIDKSREEEWVFKYPYCRSFEDWNKWSKFLCEKLNLDIDTEVIDITNLILEISQETITSNVLLAATTYTEKLKELKLEVNRTEEEINLDFKLLVEKVPGTELNLEIYRELIKEHKLSFDIIKTICEDGLNLEIESKKVFIKTPLDKYEITAMGGKINENYLESLGRKITKNKKDFLQDYK